MPQTPPQTDTYNTALDIFDRTHPLRVDTDENLKVTLAGSGGVTIGTVDQGIGGASPWLITGTVNLASGSIEIGTVDQGTPAINANAWPVYIQKALTATITAIVVTTTPTLLLGSSLSRQSFIIQNTSTSPIFITLDSTSSTTLYSVYLPSRGIYEDGGYCGPITAVTASGSITVMVTEKL